jgi:hypothetical protein
MKILLVHKTFPDVSMKPNASRVAESIAGKNGQIFHTNCRWEFSERRLVIDIVGGISSRS